MAFALGRKKKKKAATSFASAATSFPAAVPSFVPATDMPFAQPTSFSFGVGTGTENVQPSAPVESAAVGAQEAAFSASFAKFNLGTPTKKGRGSKKSGGSGRRRRVVRAKGEKATSTKWAAPKSPPAPASFGPTAAEASASTATTPPPPPLREEMRSPLAPLSAPLGVAVGRTATSSSYSSSYSSSSSSVGAAAAAAPPIPAATVPPPVLVPGAHLGSFDRAALRAVAILAARRGDVAGATALSMRVARLIECDWCRPDGSTLRGALALALASARDLREQNARLLETNDRLEVVVCRQQIVIDRLNVVAEREKQREMEKKIEKRRASEAAANAKRQREAVKEHRKREAAEEASEKLRSKSKARAAKRIATWKEAASEDVSSQPLRDLLFTLHDLLPRFVNDAMFTALREASRNAADKDYVKALRRAKRQTLGLLHPDKLRGSDDALLAEMAYATISSVELPELGASRAGPRRSSYGGGSSSASYGSSSSRSYGDSSGGGSSSRNDRSRSCTDCGRACSRVDFSKTQWRSRRGSRCMRCVRQTTGSDYGGWGDF